MHRSFLTSVAWSHSLSYPWKGLGRLKKGDQGFLAHVALGLTADGRRLPLGVVGFVPWVRTGPPRRRKKNGKKKSGSDYAKEDDKESSRWGGLIDEVASRIGARASLVHVICLPIAWQMLLLRNVARTTPDAPATAVLTPTQIEVLQSCAPHKLTCHHRRFARCCSRWPHWVAT